MPKLLLIDGNTVGAAPVIAPGTWPELVIEDPVDAELRLLAQATSSEHALPVELAEQLAALRAASA